MYAKLEPYETHQLIGKPIIIVSQPLEINSVESVVFINTTNNCIG